jgi:hypothetical protein
MHYVDLLRIWSEEFSGFRVIAEDPLLKSFHGYH